MSAILSGPEASPVGPAHGVDDGWLSRVARHPDSECTRPLVKPGPSGNWCRLWPPLGLGDLDGSQRAAVPGAAAAVDVPRHVQPGTRRVDRGALGADRDAAVLLL